MVNTLKSPLNLWLAAVGKLFNMATLTLPCLNSWDCPNMGHGHYKGDAYFDKSGMTSYFSNMIRTRRADLHYPAKKYQKYSKSHVPPEKLI